MTMRDDSMMKEQMMDKMMNMMTQDGKKNVVALLLLISPYLQRETQGDNIHLAEGLILIIIAIVINYKQ
jgi:hypothetical protein